MLLAADAAPPPPPPDTFLPIIELRRLSGSSCCCGLPPPTAAAPACCCWNCCCIPKNIAVLLLLLFGMALFCPSIPVFVIAAATPPLTEEEPSPANALAVIPWFSTGPCGVIIMAECMAATELLLLDMPTTLFRGCCCCCCPIIICPPGIVGTPPTPMPFDDDPVGIGIWNCCSPPRRCRCGWWPCWCCCRSIICCCSR